MLSAVENSKEAAQLLLQHGASMRCVDIKGYTPIYLCAKHGNYDLLQHFLKEPEAEVNVKSKVRVGVVFPCLFNNEG